MRALVIDDSATARNVLRQMLHELGFQVTLAADGKEGLESLEHDGRPDVVLVDWEMPVMDGLAFVRAVRQDRRFRDLRLVMVTTRSRQSQVTEAILGGADEYVMKPFNVEVIAEKLALVGLSVAAGPQGSLPPTTSSSIPANAPATSAAPRTGPSAAPPQPAGAAPQAVVPPKLDLPAPSRPSTAPAGPIQVLIVDDSAVVRTMMVLALSHDPEIALPATAADGGIALQEIPRVRPDVVLLDLQMPNMDGLTTLKAIRQSYPRLPVIIFSTLAAPGAAETVEALMLGADDYVTKPQDVGNLDTVKQCIRDAIVPKMKQLAPRGRGVWVEETVAAASESGAARAGRVRRRQPVGIVVIAASTGGPNALATLLPAIVPGCPVPIVIVQHMPPTFTQYLAERLASQLGAPVSDGCDGKVLEAGRVWIAPGGRHLTMARRGSSVLLVTNEDAPINACRPAADVLFASAAEAYGPGALAVVLTGMGRDGLDGCRSITEAGGQAIVQDEHSSVVWSMPGGVARAGLADQVLPLDELGPEIVRRLKQGRP